MSSFYRHSTVAFGLVAVALGLALLIETAVVSGGSLGYLLGVLFLALGCGRLYLVRRR